MVGGCRNVSFKDNRGIFFDRVTAKTTSRLSPVLLVKVEKKTTSLFAKTLVSSILRMDVECFPSPFYKYSRSFVNILLENLD